MVATSFGMILLMSLLSGGNQVDIVSALPSGDYFKARSIEPSIDRLMEMAAQNPENGKKQIGQLMALRHLVGEAETLKKSAKSAEYRKTLADIAASKLAADPSGFAADYAKRLIHALDGSKPAAVPPARSWKDGLNLFPANASMVAGIEMGGSPTNDRGSASFGLIFNVLPKEIKDEVFTEIEKFGNVQIERISFAFVNPSEAKSSKEIYVRYAGRGNPTWLKEAMGPVVQSLVETTDAKGEKIATFLTGNDGPAIALVGTTEIFVAGYPPEFNAQDKKKDHREVLNRMLAQRGKLGTGPLEGTLKAELAKIPTDAAALFVGNIPKDFAPQGTPFPTQISTHAKRTVGGLDVQFHGTMTDEEQAKMLVTMVAKFRDMGLQELNKLQGQPLPIPGLNIGSMITMLESLQLQAQGNATIMRAIVPEEAMMILPGFAIMGARFGGGQAPAPMPPVEEKKK